MNGVLIDDRRIKVDFSQSVSKYWYNYNKNNVTSSEGGEEKKKKTNEENVLTLVNENIKLEMKHNNNFNPDNKKERYGLVFNKSRERSRSRSKSRHRHHHHSHHHHHSRSKK